LPDLNVRQKILTVLKRSIQSALFVLVPWTVLIVNIVLASLAIWALIRQYGVSTVGSDGLLPTPWETGYAPYILGLLSTTGNRILPSIVDANHDLSAGTARGRDPRL
jgi:hypothetical protein